MLRTVGIGGGARRAYLFGVKYGSSSGADEIASHIFERRPAAVLMESFNVGDATTVESGGLLRYAEALPRRGLEAATRCVAEPDFRAAWTAESVATLSALAVAAEVRFADRLHRAIAHVHDTHQINGSVVEVGVHHGKFYLALDQARRDGERGFALDVFDSQGLNIDKSGKGSLHLFEQHLGRVSRQPNATRVVAGDSTRLAHSPRVRELLSPCRIFSLDGGHTAGHTASDLRFAESVLTNGGVVLVDDVMNPEWPGVFQGVSAYMASSPSLVPFAYAGNKLLLTTLSMHDAVLREYSRAMASYAVCRCWAGCPGLPKGSMCFANKPWFGHAVHSAVGLGDGGLRGEHQKQLGPSDASAPDAEARGASGGGPPGANGARAGHKMRPGGTAAFLASRLASGLKS